MKNSNDTIGNRTRDLPTCSAVPPTALPRAPRIVPWQHKNTLLLSKVIINSKILQFLGVVYFVISEE
jgi:hypothetical protein